MKMRRPISIAAALALAASASLSTSACTGIAVSTMVPILENSKEVALASDDVRTFKEATPSNLFLLEGLIATKPGDERLRLSAAMLYFSYAFLLEDEAGRDYPSKLYLKGLEHAQAVLFKNKKIAEAWEAPFDEFAAGVEQAREKDLPALVWAVANWTQFISLHLDSTKVMTDIPRAELLLDKAVELDGAFFEGLPYIILGSLHAFRPPMMGGKPEASLENFEAAFAVSDRKFLLAQYFYARFYSYRMMDGEIFDAALGEVLEKPVDVLPEYRLLNVIAKEKAARLLGEKDELF